MYNSHPYSEEYSNLKETITNVFNGNDTTTDLEDLMNHIDELYAANKLSTGQYSELLDYIDSLI